MSSAEDMMQQIEEIATDIAERAAAIPMGDRVPYSVVIAISRLVDDLRLVRSHLESLTEDDTRDRGRRVI